MGPVPDDPSIPDGLLEILDDDYTHIGWIQTNWGTYNSTNGETWPSCGDVDGDGRDESIVGLGQDGGGYIEIFDDALAGYPHLAWAKVHWSSYNSANGETWPGAKE